MILQSRDPGAVSPKTVMVVNTRRRLVAEAHQRVNEASSLLC